jgi:hypothetical protein
MKHYNFILAQILPKFKNKFFNSSFIQLTEAEYHDVEEQHAVKDFIYFLMLPMGLLAGMVICG